MNYFVCLEIHQLKKTLQHLVVCVNKRIQVKTTDVLIFFLKYIYFFSTNNPASNPSPSQNPADQDGVTR